MWAIKDDAHNLCYSWDSANQQPNMEAHMARIDEVKTIMAHLEDDMDKFYNKGNKAAGTRARKHLQDLKNLAQVIRKEIQEKKNAG